MAGVWAVHTARGKAGTITDTGNGLVASTQALQSMADAAARRGGAAYLDGYSNGYVWTVPSGHVAKAAGDAGPKAPGTTPPATPPGGQPIPPEVPATNVAWPGWAYDLTLSSIYTDEIAQAFRTAASKAGVLLRDWWAGRLAATRAGLVDMISDLVGGHVGAVLRRLWTEGWYLGHHSARGVARQEIPDWGTWTPGDLEAAQGVATAPRLQALLASHGISMIRSIAQTRMQDLAGEIADAVANGDPWEDLAGRLEQILRVPQRAPMIARTEIARAVAAASFDQYLEHGVEGKEWAVAPDERVCPVCRKNEAAGGIPLLSLFPSGDLGPPAHPNCVIGSTQVAVPGGVVAGDVPERLAANLAPLGAGLPGDGGAASASAVAEAGRDFRRGNIRAVSDREYVGDVITIRTALGHQLTATPNHPIATRRGWVPVAELQVGDYVLSSTGREWAAAGVDPDVDDIPPRIEQVAQALPVEFGPVPVSAEDFHGDGANSEVYVVRSDRLLVGDRVGRVAEHASEDDLCGRHVAACRALLFDRPGLESEPFIGPGGATHSVVGGGGEAGAFLWGSAGHADGHGLAAASGLDAGFYEPSADGSPVDAEGFCERLLALAPGVAADEVVHVERVGFTGHVFNLDTVDGWYIGNGIVTHNCRCAPMPTEVHGLDITGTWPKPAVKAALGDQTLWPDLLDVAKAAWEHELRGPHGRWARSGAGEEIGEHARQWAGSHAGSLHPRDLRFEETTRYREEHLDPVFHYTPDQVQAIHDYTEFAFHDVNNGLRGGGDGGRTARHLAEAMQPLPEDLTLLREVNGDHALDGLARGDVIADQGFSSTTLSGGGRFASNHSGTTVMHIMTPAGTPVVWTGQHASYPENEVILDAGQPLAFLKAGPHPGRENVTDAYFVALPKSVAA